MVFDNALKKVVFEQAEMIALRNLQSTNETLDYRFGIQEFIRVIIIDNFTFLCY